MEQSQLYSFQLANAQPKILKNKILGPIYKKAIPLLDDCHIVLTSREKIEVSELPEMFNLPFQKIWMERLMYECMPFESPKGVYECGIEFLVAEEIDPETCKVFYAFARTPQSKLEWEERVVHISSWFGIWLAGRLDEIHSSPKTYIAKTKTKKTSMGKINAISDIVVCYDRPFQTKEHPQFTEIKYNHSWEVRGHWRRCANIGRDRSGHYRVNGYTWVKPHVKGDGELIKKRRVFL